MGCKMKSINNLNTLKALIRDEDMASKEYLALSKGKDVPAYMQEKLIQMSRDEARHKANLIAHFNYLKSRR